MARTDAPSALDTAKSDLDSTKKTVPEVKSIATGRQNDGRYLSTITVQIDANTHTTAKDRSEVHEIHTDLTPEEASPH
jgi:hypothetical protein